MLRKRIAWDRKDTTKNRMRKGRSQNYLSMIECNLQFRYDIDWEPSGFSGIIASFDFVLFFFYQSVISNGYDKFTGISSACRICFQLFNELRHNAFVGIEQFHG